MRPPVSRVPVSRRTGRLAAMSASSMQSDDHEAGSIAAKAKVARANVIRRGAQVRVRGVALQSQVRAHDIFGQELDPYADSDGFAVGDI